MFDTISVNWWVDTTGTYPDTLAQLKTGVPQSINGKTAIFWDARKNQKYKEWGAKWDGIDVTYHRNGQISKYVANKDSAGNYLGDKFIWAAWFPDGTVRGEQIVVGDTRTTLHYYPSGRLQKKDVGVWNCNPNFPDTYCYVYTEEYCDNGRIAFKDSVSVAKFRDIIRHHCNGTKALQLYSNGSNSLGEYRTWYDNGQLEISGQYDSSIPDSLQLYFGISKKQGAWRYFDTKGALIKVEHYQNGVMVKTEED